MSGEYTQVCLDAVKVGAERNQYLSSLLNEMKVFKSVYRRGACYCVAVKKDGTLVLFKIFANGFARKIMEIPADVAIDYAKAVSEAVVEAEKGSGS